MNCCQLFRISYVYLQSFVKEWVLLLILAELWWLILSPKLFRHLDHLVSPIDGLSIDDIGPHCNTFDVHKVLDTEGEYFAITLLNLIETKFHSIVVWSDVHEESQSQICISRVSHRFWHVSLSRKSFDLFINWKALLLGLVFLFAILFLLSNKPCISRRFESL